MEKIKYAAQSLAHFTTAICCCLFFAQASYAGDSISLITSHSESRLLTLLRDEAQHQGIELKAIFVDQEQLKSELLRSLDENSLPDVLIVPPDISNLSTLAVQTLPEDWFLKSLAPQVIEQIPVVMQRKAIPFVVGNHLLQFYNKSLVKQPLTNWQDLKSSYTRPIFSWSYNEMYWFVPFVLSRGTRFLEGGQAHLDSESMVSALTDYKGLASRGVIDPNCNYQCSLKRFVNAEVPYHINGTWSVEELKAALGNDLGVATLPSFDGKPMRSYYGAYVVIFPALHRHSTEKISQLKQFARHIQSEEVQLSLLKSGYQMPINSVARQQFIDSANPIQRAFVLQLEQSVIMPDITEMVIVWDAMSRGFVRYSGGVLSAPAASRYMERTFHRFNRQQ